MKRLCFPVVLGIVVFSLSSFVARAQEVPGRGFSALLCLAEQVGSQIGGGQVTVSIDSDTGSMAQVTITHGTSSSTHDVVYEDTNSTGHLDCGDLIVSVS